MEWDDLRYVLAVGRAGSLSGAARSLGVNHSTVFRRIGLIEEKLGVRLFERFRDGYSPTPSGEKACRLAAQLDEDIQDLERRLMGLDIRPHGTLRLTTTDTLVALLTPLLATFRCDYPEIELEVVVSNENFNLSRREADIAVRPTREPPDMLIGRRLCDIATAVYASRGYQDTVHAGAELADQLWIAPDDSLVHLRSGAWQRRCYPNARIAYRANTLLGLLEAAKAGLGIAALPCFLGDPEPSLVRLRPPIDELATGFWLLTHRDLRNVARVKVFFGHMVDAIKQKQGLLEGDNVGT